MRKTILPESITLPTGEILYPVIGGHLKNKPFLTIEHSSVDVTKNGWESDLIDKEESLIIAEAKRQKLKYRRVQVLSRGLRGKLDLHYRQYRPTIWVFVEVRRFKVERDCCTSGNCIKCINARHVDPSMKPFQCIRITQLDDLTKEKAELVAHNFRAYNSKVLVSI